MNNYILELYKQFCFAKGLKYEPRINKSIEEDFIKWIIELKGLTSKYKSYLLSLNAINNKIVLEVDKGKYDTLHLNKSMIISSYGNTLGVPSSSLVLIDNIPFINLNNNLYMPNSDVILTYNPYNFLKIQDWYKIHNSNLFDISIGVFGSTFDEDYKAKVAMLDRVRKNMNDDYLFSYDIDKNNYYCVVNSKRQIKRRILIR